MGFTFRRNFLSKLSRNVQYTHALAETRSNATYLKSHSIHRDAVYDQPTCSYNGLRGGQLSRYLHRGAKWHCAR